MENSDFVWKEPEGWKWDKWQREVLEYSGNITLRTGRQVGKSEVVGAKACRFALMNPKSTTLIIAASQRQAALLFDKVKANIDRLEDLEGSQLYADKPTMTRIRLRNGSKIHCLPAGRQGYFIRGFTIDLLIADEAAYINDAVWTAVIPMIAVAQKARGLGHVILLSTPFGQSGYFYDSFNDPDFKSFHVSSEDCERIPKSFLEKERLRMTASQYRQEYLGEFADDTTQFFSTRLIKERTTFTAWSFESDFVKNGRYYLGVDFARYGGDENAFVVVEWVGKVLRVVFLDTTFRVSCTDTIGRILSLDSKFHFRKIFVDDAGIGGGITDVLIEKLGRKVLGLNNASRRIEIQGEERRRGILKEDLYNNCLLLLESAMLDLIQNPYLMKSLKSITFEYGTDGKNSGRQIRIFGLYNHLAEALVRACWCTKERGLSIFRF